MNANKPWRTLQAELLIGGFQAELISGDTGQPTLVVARWALVREFDDLDQARAWAEQVLGKAAISTQRRIGAGLSDHAAQDVRPIWDMHEIRK